MNFLRDSEGVILSGAKDDTHCAQDDTHCAQDDTRRAQDDTRRAQDDTRGVMRGRPRAALVQSRVLNSPMGRLLLALICLPVIACATGGCEGGIPLFTDRPIETSFAFTNFSTQQYAVLEIREHTGSGGAFHETPLLPPGATHRVRFLDSLQTPCPGALDLRVRLYRRMDADVPIGLDEDEAVESAPVAAGQIENIPACDVQVLETFTIVNWDTPEGIGRVKLAQNTRIDDAIREAGLFPNPDAVWEFEGVDPELASRQAPGLPADVPIAGRVTLADGTPVSGVGVVLRTRFRTRLNDDDNTNDPDAGFGDPIAVTFADNDGTYRFDRPAGAYQLEFFSDDFLFRPVTITLETPSEVIDAIAEPVS